MHETKAIRFRELQRLIGISRSTVFRWERDGLFPKHFKLGKNSVAWLLSDIEKWLSERSKKQI